MRGVGDDDVLVRVESVKCSRVLVAGVGHRDDNKRPECDDQRAGEVASDYSTTTQLEQTVIRALETFTHTVTDCTRTT